MKKFFCSWFVVALTVLCADALHADIFVRDAGGNIIYQYSNDVMYEGHARNNKKLFRYYPKRGTIERMNGKVIATWKKDNALYNRDGRKWYALEGKKVRKGLKVVAFVDGRKVFRGNGPGGKLTLYADSPLPLPVAVYLFHVATAGDSGKAEDAPAKVQIEFSQIPYGYYLGEKGKGPVAFALRGNTIYYDEAMTKVAYTRRGLCFYKAGNSGMPDFCMDKNGALYKGSERTPANLVMRLEWFNCYAAGKSGKDAIGTLQYVGENILTEGYTAPSNRPDFTGKRVLLSSTLPNNKVDMVLRIFIVYLTQLDPEFRAYLNSVK